MIEFALTLLAARRKMIIDSRDFVNAFYNKELSIMAEELKALQKKCRHSFDNCICVTCGKNEND